MNPGIVVGLLISLFVWGMAGYFFYRVYKSERSRS